MGWGDGVLWVQLTGSSTAERMGDYPAWICVAFLSMALRTLGGAFSLLLLVRDWEVSKSKTTRFLLFSVGRGGKVLFSTALYLAHLASRVAPYCTC